MLLSMFPSILWLGNYQWKEDLIKDVIAGCTVAVMNIPQGINTISVSLTVAKHSHNTHTHIHKSHNLNIFVKTTLFV